jgi:symplekin
LTRFLSEIPGLNANVLERVKSLCRDPAMVNLALTSLLYLVIMRPPVREIVLDAVEDVWNTCKPFSLQNIITLLTDIDEDAKPIAAKYLAKWRPGFADKQNGPEDEKKKDNVVTAAA